ncbi:hypothetical protein JVT61DRAFT_7132 [Boletus reticuloceps]|uniref:Uncharacterized protein n=1 Tax=Boletus reticuloceps TaxID=495285 RepID=A0A8I3A7J7_9AGAM|nr:hypothetical protein JVT61DRAFT_7132 [Boletus reticuloceps]
MVDGIPMYATSFFHISTWLIQCTQCDLREDDCDWFRWAFEDSDVHGIPQSPPPRTSSSHKRKRSPSIEVSSPFPAKRKHSPSIEISSPQPTSGHMYDQQIALLLYARHRASTSYRLPKINLASSLPPECSSTSSMERPQPPQVWPFDFYANKMDIGFKRCRLESNKQQPVEKVFLDQFHVKFVRSTYYDHRRHWMSVSQSVCERYIGYGQTERGRWSTFIRQEIRGERQMGQR